MKNSNNVHSRVLNAYLQDEAKVKLTMTEDQIKSQVEHHIMDEGGLQELGDWWSRTLLTQGQEHIDQVLQDLKDTYGAPTHDYLTLVFSVNKVYNGEPF